MNNGRKFIRSAGSLIAGGALFSNRSIASFLARPSYPPPGLQLFTLFNVMDDDVRGSLKKVAAIGFKEVEPAFSKKGEYYGMSAIPPDKMPKGPDGKPISIPPMHQQQQDCSISLSNTTCRRTLMQVLRKVIIISPQH